MGDGSDFVRAVGRALRPVRPGFRALACNRRGLFDAPATITLSSSSFDNGTKLPLRCTADGEGISPGLAWRGVPEEAASLVLLVEDPDAPLLNPIVHAIVVGLPLGEGTLEEGVMPNRRRAPGAERMGRNSFAGRAWLPPSPPPGHGPHRYCFQIFALDSAPRFPHPPGRGLLLSTINGHVMAKGLLVGTYERV